MRRFVFRPSWMLGHLIVVTAVACCLLLGDWQWTRALSTAAVQNWGYALQWPLFAVFFVVAWWRMLRLESHRLDEQAAADSSHPADSVDGGAPPREQPPVLAPPVVPAAPAPAGHSDVPDDDAEDGALAAYNRMLAALAAQDERSSP